MMLAEIRRQAVPIAPVGLAECRGQLLPISQNTALFELLGTTFGGDGKQTFALPNLPVDSGPRYFIAMQGEFPPFQ
jgi:microcystin-dependent protein